MIDIEKVALIQLLGINTKRRYVFIGGGGCFRNFCEKSRGLPTFQNGLMHDPLQIHTQKHLTLPPPSPRQTRPCEQGNWDTWMVLDPWNQV